MLWAWRGASPLGAARDGFVFAVVFLGVVLAGLTHTGYTGTVSLVVAAALYYAAAGVLAAALARRGLRSPWLTAAVWVFFESLRGRWPLGGLAWGELGVAFHDLGVARAVASVGGVALVTFLAVAANGLVLDLVTTRTARVRGAWRSAAVGLAAVLLVAVISDITRYQPSVTGHLRYALLQGDDQGNGSTAEQVADQALTDAHFALAANLRGHYDLIVFPESALSGDPESDPVLRDRIVAVAAAHGAVVLVNARYQSGTRLYNANLAYGPDGRVLGVYAKQHLVPFGEYVPFRDQLSFVSDLRQIPYDFTAGTRRVLFTVAGRRVGTVICYESAYGPLVRDVVEGGAQAIVVSTSDRSYGRSGIPATHVAVGQMRAAETGRPVLHAAISGETAVIDADGNLLQHTPLFAKRIVTGTVALTTGETPYDRLGDWVLAASAVALLAAAAVAARRSRDEARP